MPPTPPFSSKQLCPTCYLPLPHGEAFHTPENVAHAVRPEILAFAEAIEAKLRTVEARTEGRRHTRDDWRTEDIHHLVAHFWEEVREVSDAQDAGLPTAGELVDIAAMTMFLWNREREDGGRESGQEDRELASRDPGAEGPMTDAPERLAATNPAAPDWRDAYYQGKKDGIAQTERDFRALEAELARVSAGWTEVNERLGHLQTERDGIAEERDALKAQSEKWFDACARESGRAEKAEARVADAVGRWAAWQKYALSLEQGRIHVREVLEATLAELDAKKEAP